MPGDWLILTAVFCTFLLAGFVKGTIGMGLPVVSMSILTVFLGLPKAMLLMLLPSLASNLWQMLYGGEFIKLFLRLFSYVVALCATVWLGVWIFTIFEARIMSALLGTLVVCYCVTSLSGITFTLPPRHEIWVNPLIGSINGLFAGMTGAFVFPGALFLQSLSLNRNQFVQALGLLFGVATLALTISLLAFGITSNDNSLAVIFQQPRENESVWLLAVVSLLSLIPTFMGMWVGFRLRQYLSEQQFRLVVLYALLLLGSYITLSALWG